MTLNKTAIKAAAIIVLTKGLNGLLVVIGIAAIAYGIWQVFPPASYVFVGAALIWMGLPDKSDVKVAP
ncbi:hypothetical protein [Zhongshania marina]|uniref:Uncharacterized protein n=1 Tax=Zhongshania marina TaxID=2304603 RepID=A0A2S4HGF5_9GAMM|nr:hypothetical protein [Marortus luteolus]POP53074.1 hypothetical protein C0068_08255 [Marortus luteolus]